MSDVDQRPERRAEAQRRFDILAVGFIDRPGVSRGPMFGSIGLRAGDRFFAFVGRDGRLVVKLPPAQAATLVSAGEAAPVRAGRNLTREWVAVPFSGGTGGPAHY